MFPKSIFNVLTVCTPFLIAPVQAADTINPVTKDLPSVSEPTTNTGSELNTMDHLIETTAQSLENQKKLRKQLQEYLTVQSQYMQNTNDKELALQMIKSAQQLLDQIKEENLIHVFSSNFISELTMFANIASKRSVPRP